MEENPPALNSSAANPGATVESKPGTPPLPPPRKRRRTLPLIIGLIVLILIAAVIVFYLHFIAPYESTDDAFIEGYVPFVSPRVPGQVIRLAVRDNELVKEGDLLVEIDPRDFKTALEQATANLAAAQTQLEQAKAQVILDEARVAQQKAVLVAAEAEARRSEADLRRYQSVESRAVSQTQLDLTRTQATSSTASVEQARQQENAAEAELNLSQVGIKTAAARVQQYAAALHQAELNLSYTKVIAPITGKVTRRTIDQGAYVQTGQSLLALVPSQVWVVANFKETQLTHMRPGQPVRIHVDAYPQHEYQGKVDSLQAGTGSRFSLLPPENAVGNFVKVVQRIPVKILFDETLDPKLDFAPGMSVEPKVRVK
jgi:membrane fusion protein (multidrug efflux system)